MIFFFRLKENIMILLENLKCLIIFNVCVVGMPSYLNVKTHFYINTYCLNNKNRRVK